MLRIGLLDHMGLGNLGDAATQDAVIYHLKKRDPTVEIVLFSLNPEDSSRRHGFPAFPISWRGPGIESARDSKGKSVSSKPEDTRPVGLWIQLKSALRKSSTLDRAFALQWNLRQELRFMIKSYRHIKGVDLFVISGGGQLDDSWGGARAVPANLLRWSILARIAGAKLVFLGVGAGPLEARASRVLCRFALRLAHSISLRDEQSRRFVETLGVGKPASVIPDLAHSLPVLRDQDRSRPDPNSLVLGICPVPYKDPRWWPEKDFPAYETYIDKLSSFAASVIQQGHTIRFLAGDITMDETAISDIIQRLDGDLPDAKRSSLHQERIATVDDLIGQLAKTDIVLSSRFHGVLLGYLLQKPAIGVSYHEKIDHLMADMGQPDAAVEIDDFDVNDLSRIFEAIRAGLTRIQSTLDTRGAEYRDKLDQVYDDLITR